MPQDNPKRPDLIAGDSRLLIIPVILAGMLAWFPVYSGDIWMHLASAREIISRGEIPGQDIFLYTAEGRRWINHSWGAQIIFYSLFQSGEKLGIGGINLLVALRILLAGGIATLFSLFAAKRSRDYTMAAIAASGLIIIASSSFIIRPLMFSPLLAGGILLCLLSPTRKKVLLAAILQMCWANMHAGFLLGIAIAGAFALEKTYCYLRENDTDKKAVASKECSLSWIACLALALVSLINPNGYELFLYGHELGKLGWVENTVREWMAPDFSSGPGRIFLYAIISIWFTCGVCAWKKERIALMDFLALGAFTLQAFSSRRFAFLWCCFAIAPLSFSLARLVPDKDKTRKLVTAALSLIVCAMAINGAAGNLRAGRFGFGLTPGALPVDAIKYMRENGIKGNIANAPYAGGYIEWEFTEARAATDGRCLVNDPETIKAFNALANNRPGWEAAFPPKGTSDVMLIETSYRTPVYTKRNEWAVTFWDETWCVLLRRGGEYQDIIAKSDLTLSSPNILPYISREELSPTEKKTQEAQLLTQIERNPKNGFACALLAYVYYHNSVELLARSLNAKAQATQAQRQKDKEKSARLLAQAAKIEESAAKYLANSNSLYERDILLTPGQSRSIHGMARNLFWTGDYRNSEELFRKAAAIDPLVWLYAIDNMGYALTYVEAAYGSKSLRYSDGEKLLKKFRIYARANRTLIAGEYEKMQRPDEVPQWLFAPATTE